MHTAIPATISFCFLSCAAQAATITALSPTSLVIEAPAAVTDTVPGSNSAVIAFAERGDVLLDQDIAVLGGTLTAGTRVDSHMVLLNRADAASVVLEVSYDFQFGGQIAGVIGDAADVAASHEIFGAVGTTYGALHRLEGDDNFTVSGDRITGFMRVQQPGDWFRVLTFNTTDTSVLSQTVGIPAPVPLPTSGGLLALAWAGLALRARSKAAC